MTIIGSENFPQWAPDDGVEHALVKHVSESTNSGLRQGSSLLVLVITDATEATACPNILPLANSDHVALALMLQACDIMNDQVGSRPKMCRANETKINELAATTGWSVNTSASIEEAWVVSEGAYSYNIPPFTQLLAPCRPNKCSPYIIKRIKKRPECGK